MADERDDLPEEEPPPEPPLPDDELLAEPPLFFALLPDADFDAPPLLAPPERPADLAAVDEAERPDELEPDLAELLEEPLPDEVDFDDPPELFLAPVLLDLELPPDFAPPADLAALVDLALPLLFEAPVEDLPPLFADVPDDLDEEPPALLAVDPPDLLAVELDDRPDALFEVEPDDFLEDDPPDGDFEREPELLLVPPPVPSVAMSAAVAAAPITAPRAAPVASSVTISTAPSSALSSVPFPPPDLFFVEPDCFLVAAIFFCLLIKFARLNCGREYTYASAWAHLQIASVL